MKYFGSGTRIASFLPPLLALHKRKFYFLKVWAQNVAAPLPANGEVPAKRPGGDSLSGLRLRRGFTFAEALTMVIITGLCMYPILGTMDSSLTRTKSLELRAAMQNAAESKMNEIIAKASYEDTTPSNQTSVIDYPNSTDPEYHFNVSVEALSGINIDGTAPIAPLTGAQDQNFRAVSVVVSLQETEPSIENVKLFAMVTKPPVPGDMVYAANRTDEKIYVINPKSHATIETLGPPQRSAK